MRLTWPAATVNYQARVAATVQSAGQVGAKRGRRPFEDGRRLARRVAADRVAAAKTIQHSDGGPTSGRRTSLWRAVRTGRSAKFFVQCNIYANLMP